jgi:hypothetical protein
MVNTVHDTDGKDAQEQRLSELLERAVPILPAPPDRMRQVRRRVVRGRRRRAAAAAAVTGAAAIALLYGSLGTWSSGSPASTRTQLDFPSSSGRHLDLSNWTLSFDLPHGWYARERTDRSGAVTVFVADRPMPAEGTCPPTATGGVYDCAPLSALAKGETLISFRQAERPLAVDTGTRGESSAYPGPGAGCRALGGDQELLRPGWTGRSDGTSFPVDAHVCLRGVSATTLDEVSDLLDSAAVAPKR